MPIFSAVRLFVLSLLSAAVCAATAAQTGPESFASVATSGREVSSVPAVQDDIFETRASVHPFKTLVDPDRRLVLTGLKPELVIPFSVARDEIAVKAQLTLLWTASPSLIPVRSQLNVRLNGQLQKSIALTREMLGKNATLNIEINPKDFKDENEFQLDFVGAYTDACETAMHRTLWLQINHDSELKVVTQKIRVANELQLLPLPFVDKATRSRLTLPFVFGEHIDDGTLQAAAVVASWGGLQAQWRGAQFPVYFDEQPVGSHFIVFATAKSKPSFLRELPEITGPEILIADAPSSSWAKMLIVAGRDDKELLAAARALALQSDTLSGSRSIVRTPLNTALRSAYDAPKWIRTDRKVTFSELMSYKQQLSSSGATPDPVHLDFSLPPDLYVLPRTHVPLELNYRYTPPAQDSASSLRILINGSIMEIHPLERDSDGIEKNVRRLPALDSMASWLRSLNLPAVYLDASNRLTFDFQYSLVLPAGNAAGNCVAMTVPDNHVEVMPTSSLDFRGFYHFAELPNTRLFTQSGYPFSRYADLAQTVVALDARPQAEEISTMLAAVGRIAAQTGAAATYVTVTTSADESLLRDKDVLVISRLPTDSDPSRYKTVFADKILASLRPADETHAQDKRRVQVDVFNFTSDRQAAIVQFESPLTRKRSVVALLALPGNGAKTLANKLATPGSMADAQGALSYVAGDVSVNFFTSQVYSISDLPWYQTLWLYFFDRPGLLLFCAVLALVFAVVVITILMKRLVAKRMRDQKKALAAIRGPR